MKVALSVDECMERDLKPCPFCGGERLVLYEDESDGKTEEWVECANSRCGCLGPMWRKTRDHSLAIKYWNLRCGE